MALAWVAHRGSASDKVSDTTIAVSPSANISAGALLLARCAADNIGTTDADDTTEHTVSDSKGNTWTKLKERRRSIGAAADGVTVSLWQCIVTTAILTSDTVTLTTSSAVTSKSIGLEECSKTKANVFAGAKNTASGLGTGPSVALTDIANVSHLLVGLVGIEGPNSDTYTQDADYANNTSIGTDAGGGATNVSTRFGTRVATITSDTFAPTLGTSRDFAAMLIVLEECDGPYPGAVTTETATSATVTLNKPADAAEGKAVEAHIYVETVTVTSVPSGWTEKAAALQAGPTPNYRHYWYEKVMAAGEGASWNWGLSASDYHEGFAVTVHAADTTAPMDVDAQTVNSLQNDNPIAPSVNASQANSLLFCAYNSADGGTANWNVASSGLGQWLESTSKYLCYQTDVPAGATGSKTVGVSGGINPEWHVGGSYVIKPPSTAPPTLHESLHRRRRAIPPYRPLPEPAHDFARDPLGII